MVENTKLKISAIMSDTDNPLILYTIH